MQCSVHNCLLLLQGLGSHRLRQLSSQKQLAIPAFKVLSLEAYLVYRILFQGSGFTGYRIALSDLSFHHFENKVRFGFRSSE